MRYLHNVGDLPSERAYMIATQGSIHVPGDERSRTAPGHGYPARTEQYVELQSFDNEDEWKAEIQNLMGRTTRPAFKAFIFEPATVSTTVQVQVG